MESRTEIFNKQLKLNDIDIKTIPFKVGMAILDAMEEYKNKNLISKDDGKFVYRKLAKKNNSIYNTYEIGWCTDPRSFPKGWCDMRICEGFWGEEEMCKNIVELLNINRKNLIWIK